MISQHKHNWVRRVEHMVLRVVSLVFSLVSAHAILWFFSSLDRVDVLQPFVKWGIAGGFGILGYFVSRGLAHRLLNKEPVRAYIFICGVFELVEIVCNFAMAAVAVRWIDWLGLLPSLLHTVLMLLTYIVLSIIPVVTIMLAWVDMDLERAKQGYAVQGFGVPVAARAPVMPYGAARPAAAAQLKPSGFTSLNGQMAGPSTPANYGQGYAGVAPSLGPVPAAAPMAQESGGWWQGMRQGVSGWRDRFPLGQSRGAAPSAAPVGMPSVPPVVPVPGDGPFSGLMNNTSRMN